jgi:hypothetical protein
LPTKNLYSGNFKEELFSEIVTISEKISKVGEIGKSFAEFRETDFGSSINLAEIDLSNGSAILDVTIPESSFYKIV